MLYKTFFDGFILNSAGSASGLKVMKQALLLFIPHFENLTLFLSSELLQKGFWCNTK